eukprot:746501-Hanusia_phi.AAC.1
MLLLLLQSASDLPTVVTAYRTIVRYPVSDGPAAANSEVTLGQSSCPHRANEGTLRLRISIRDAGANQKLHCFALDNIYFGKQVRTLGCHFPASRRRSD